VWRAAQQKIQASKGMTGEFGPGTVTWIDLLSTEPEASKSFYASLFGWEPFSIGHASARRTEFLLHGKRVAGLRQMEYPWTAPSWVPYLATADGAATAAAVRNAGGKVLTPLHNVSSRGRAAVCDDPTRAAFFLWEPLQDLGFEASDEAGAYVWAELNTSDIARAWAFYQQVFGWRARVSQVRGATSDYALFQLDGTNVAGAVELTRASRSAARWLVYFGTFDVEAAAKKSSELGGTILAHPQDSAAGRFAVVSDPQGARFGLLHTVR
jgi:predicted enzyme related to lactoylglutathione lyase